MKRFFMICTGVLLTLGLLVACGPQELPAVSSPTEESPTAAQTSPPEQSAAAETSAEQVAPPYEFEFADLDGNMHKLSDYAGKPVFLRIWASWCSVCVQALPSLDEIAAEAEDFTVLTVMTPNVSGEKSSDDFAAWFKELGYQNIIVLVDEKAQIMNDFGISAFPTQIMFDAQGNAVYGAVGLMSKEDIFDTMGKLARGEAVQTK